MRNDCIKDEGEYTDAFKAELDWRYQYYQEGGRMISAEEANKQMVVFQNVSQEMFTAENKS